MGGNFSPVVQVATSTRFGLPGGQDPISVTGVAAGDYFESIVSLELLSTLQSQVNN